MINEKLRKINMLDSLGNIIEVDRAYIIDLFDRPLSDEDFNFIEYVLRLKEESEKK